MGVGPIPSMREFVEDTLGIPVVQAELSQEGIAGAAISVSDGTPDPSRGVILNTTGANQNPLVRRATLAHEVGHLLFDPDQRLAHVRVDSYNRLNADPEQKPSSGGQMDFVEQRANAFAISLLAPIDVVRESVDTPVTASHIADIGSQFGISVTAAWFHVVNAHYRNYPVHGDDKPSIDQSHWLGAENFGIDYFPIADTPMLRRGRFAGLVAAAWEDGLISSATAAGYLNCSSEVFQAQAEAIQSMHPVSRQRGSRREPAE